MGGGGQVHGCARFWFDRHSVWMPRMSDMLLVARVARHDERVDGTQVVGARRAGGERMVASGWSSISGRFAHFAVQGTTTLPRITPHVDWFSLSQTPAFPTRDAGLKSLPFGPRSSRFLFRTDAFPFKPPPSQRAARLLQVRLAASFPSRMIRIPSRRTS